MNGSVEGRSLNGDRGHSLFRCPRRPLICDLTTIVLWRCQFMSSGQVPATSDFQEVHVLGEQYLPRFILEHITLDYVALSSWAILCKILYLLDNG